jgi:hypothetical protein
MRKSIVHINFLFLIILTGVRPGFSLAQDSIIELKNIRIIQDEKVDLLLSKHIRINQNRDGIPGFRIQIFFDSGTNSKTNAQGIYEGFRAKYPDVAAYLTFKAPNYKVRVGDFRTKLDAQRFLNEINPEYPNAWIIPEQISLPKVEP